MSDPRTRRLTAEHDAMRAAFVDHPHVEVEPIGWHPPDRYRVTYRVPGVTLDASGQPALVQEHVVVITATETYPRDRPTLRAETALFHPNVSADGTGTIDSGELWTAQRTLVELVLQVGAIIQLQQYDLDVPLNAVAAGWVAEHTSIFPVGHVTLQVEPEPTEDAVGEDGPVDDGDAAAPGRPVSVWAPPDTTAT